MSCCTAATPVIRFWWTTEVTEQTERNHERDEGHERDEIIWQKMVIA